MVTPETERASAATAEEPAATQRLRALGLSEYAARAYMAALKLGRADAKSISTLARVPPSKVYEVLATLEANGLLQVFPEFPKKYGAVSLESYLDRLHREHEETARRIARERDELLRMFKPAEASEENEAGAVMVLRGYARIVEQLRGMLQDAERSWLVLGVLGTASRYVEFSDDVRAAHERGVQMRFLLPVGEVDAAGVPQLRQFAEVRSKAALKGEAAEEVAIAIADGGRAIVIHWRTPRAAPGATDVAILTDERGIVSAMESLVDMMWASSPPTKG